MNISDKVRHYADRFLSMLVPWCCALCGASFDSLDHAVRGLCDSCSTGMPRMEWPMCCICGISLSSETDTCLSCRSYEMALPEVSRLRSCFVYQDAVQKAMHAYKDGRARCLARFWAKEMTPYFQELCGEGWIITGVPGSRKNILKRGYEQVRLLLKHIGQPFRGMVVNGILMRSASSSQKELDRKGRAANLTGKIRVEGKWSGIVSSAQGILLVDDVCTTGATLSTCARALREAGAKDVRALTLCRD